MGSLDSMRLVLKICARFSQEQQAESTAETSEVSGGGMSRTAKKKAKSRAKKKVAQAGVANEATNVDGSLEALNGVLAARSNAEGETQTDDIAPLVWHSQASVLSMDQGGQDRALDEEGWAYTRFFLIF